MLIHIGATDVNANTYCFDCVSGKLDNGWFVMIWPNSYGKNNIYGVRYGQLINNKFEFIGSNRTYFEVDRNKLLNKIIID